MEPTHDDRPIRTPLTAAPRIALSERVALTHCRTDERSPIFLPPLCPKRALALTPAEFRKCVRVRVRVCVTRTRSTLIVSHCVSVCVSVSVNVRVSVCECEYECVYVCMCV